MITIVDYGMGNLGSVFNMFRKIRVQSKITGDLEEISKASKILLPGVGAFDSAMQKIGTGGMKEVLDQKALVDRIPVLGICLGMQLLTERSEEGVLPGLGWVKGSTIKFRFDKNAKMKVPHMGWNRVYEQSTSPLIVDLPKEPRFYFVHSFYVKCDNSADVTCTTPYGHDFDSIIRHENIFGAQFHPEKSHKFGMKLLENFAKI